MQWQTRKETLNLYKGTKSLQNATAFGDSRKRYSHQQARSVRLTSVLHNPINEKKGAYTWGNLMRGVEARLTGHGTTTDLGWTNQVYVPSIPRSETFHELAVDRTNSPRRSPAKMEKASEELNRFAEAVLGLSIVLSRAPKIGTTDRPILCARIREPEEKSGTGLSGTKVKFFFLAGRNARREIKII